MKIERSVNYITVGLNNDEACKVRGGNTLSKRAPLGILTEGAKIAVRPMRDLELDDSVKYSYSDERLSQGLAAKSKAKLFPNGDLEIYISDVTLADARIRGKLIPLTSIESEIPEQVLHQLPKEGVLVRFDIPSGS